MSVAETKALPGLDQIVLAVGNLRRQQSEALREAALKQRQIEYILACAGLREEVAPPTDAELLAVLGAVPRASMDTALAEITVQLAEIRALVGNPAPMVAAAEPAPAPVVPSPPAPVRRRRRPAVSSKSPAPSAPDAEGSPVPSAPSVDAVAPPLEDGTSQLPEELSSASVFVVDVPAPKAPPQGSNVIVLSQDGPRKAFLPDFLNDEQEETDSKD